MRILHVIHSIDPRSGGPSHAIRSLVRAQASAGHDVTLLTTSTQSAEPWDPADAFVQRMAADPAFDGVELRMCPAWGRRRPFSRYAYSPAARQFLNSRLASANDRRPDIIHVHGLFSHITSVVCTVARRHSVPYAIRPAGGLDPWCLQHGSRRLKQWMLATGVREDLNRASFVQAMSSAEEEHLKSSAVGSVACVPHGSCLPEGTADQKRLEQLIPGLGGRPYVLFLGRIHEKKRPEMIVDAVARLQSERPDLAIIFAGHDDGGLAGVNAAVERHGLADRVHSCGFVEGDAKFTLFALASAFVLPSRDENFGVAVVEAMAHGAPVVVTRGVASHEYVDASGCGMTVEGTPAALAAGLETVLHLDRDELGRRGRNYVREHLSWPAVVQRLDDLYHIAINSSRTECPQPLPTT